MRILLLLFFIIPLRGYSQTIRWKMVFDDIDSQTEEVLQTPDGGYLVLGAWLPGDQHEDVWLIKLDAFGNVQWDIRYVDPGIERIYSGVVLGDGGYLLAGYADGSPFLSGYLMKLAANGDIIWTKPLETDGSSSLREIKQLPDGTFVVCGWKRNNLQTPNNLEGYGARINSDGEILWERGYRLDDSNEIFNDVEPTNDGGFIFAGGANPLSNAPEQHYLLKVNAMGDQEWVHFSNGSFGNALTAVRRLPCGDYVVGGFINQNDLSAGRQMYLARFNPAGYPVWESTPHPGSIKSVELADSNHLVLGGYTLQPPYSWGKCSISRIDDNGQEDWLVNYDSGGGEEMITNVHPTPDGGYICSSWHDIPFTASDGMRIIKTDENGRINDLGFDHLAAGSLKLYPNPTNGATQLKFSDELFAQFETATAVITDIAGRVVSQTSIMEAQTTLDCSLLESGIYSVAVVVDGSTLYSEKLVVE